MTKTEERMAALQLLTAVLEVRLVNAEVDAKEAADEVLKLRSELADFRGEGRELGEKVDRLRFDFDRWGTRVWNLSAALLVAAIVAALSQVVGFRR